MNRPALVSDRRYVFDAAPETIWAALARVDAYPTWWPWLARFDGTGLWPGAEWRCAVRSPLRTTLRFTIAIGDVEPTRRISAHLAGDLNGPAEVTIDALWVDGSGGSEVRLVSELAPQDALIATVTRYARPLAGWAHDLVVDRGARQFAATLG